MFEEDMYGTIGNFVNWNQRKICDDSGYHFPTHLNRIGNIIIEVFSEQDVPIYAHRYSNCYFLRSTPITYDYTSTVAQKISITFGSEEHTFYTNEKDNIKTEKSNEKLSFTELLKKTFL